MIASYRRLVELAVRERELVTEGLFDELHGLIEERDRLVASLPSIAPAEARPSLERAAELQAQTTRALGAARAATARELARLDAGRATVRGYTPAVASAARVNLAG